MDTKELQHFIVVYKEKSLNRAAGKLFITSQGLSRIITKLENELEAKLFIRTQKGLVPTESGAFLYQSAQKLLNLFSETENGVRQLARKASQLRLVCATGVLNALSFDVILSFMKANPSIEVQWIECSNREAKGRVMGFEADVGLVLGDTDETGLVQIGLTRHKVVTMVHKSHPFFKKNIISLSDLQNEKIVTLNKDYRVNEDFHSKCAELGFSPNVVAETVDTNCLYKLCKLAVGVGILIDCSVDHFEMGDLKIIPFQEEFTWDIFALIQQQNIKFPLIQAFQAHLRDYDFQSKRSV